MFNPYTILSPGEAKGNLLDKFLAAGFYRHGASLFTTNFYPTKEGEVYNVFWLRYDIRKTQLDRQSQKILAKSQHFDVKITPFKISDELETLHQKYLQHISFYTVETLTELMVDVENHYFDSRLIEVREGNKLIAAGIMDCGKDSIAGIKNIFDPAYKKYSPGKLLMLFKYQFCLQHDIQWYYPGYYIPEYPKFNYKLFLDKKATEVYLQKTKHWTDFESFDIHVQKALNKESNQ